ncbi:DNA gyrase subunit B [Vibrio sp. UCD-FRSSP16_10]|uniref:COG4648 family protein n=1 Tax=unclassified Vibrio TaxID=2614977 RepID=UPI0008014078|nr:MULTISPECIES: hypothetical protein [unclassified Vibrio]OBT14776.1 DNA gyrase subunit B [Vibrio sp. UCD-FRSSP16_30]OBT20065.1 DNA gyrase subunit B [Vibrio sp. UCD-FRSSP16_10]
MRRLLTILSAIVLLAYPFAVYFGIDKFGFSIVGILLVLALGVRLLSVQKTQLKELKYVAQVSAVVGITLVCLGALFKQHNWLTFYPVVVNLCMLMVFASSLRQPQTIVERLARLQDPELPQSGVDYTRKVTIIWCLFFIGNGLFALYTCFHSLELWTLYNGLISYILAGCLFAGEWIVRQLLLKDR